MKKQRFLYLVGVVGAVSVVVGVLLFMVFPNALSLRGETAVSPSAPLTKQVVREEDGWLTAVSDHLHEVEYAISAIDPSADSQIAYQAPNRAQNLRTYFSETGIRVEPRLVQGEAWHFGLEILGLSNGLQTVVPEIVAHTIADNRVTMDYGTWQAWYVNDVQGVEQGFTIEEPLFAQETGLLQLDMAMTGDLAPQWVSENEVKMVTAVGEMVLSYQDLFAFDAQGTELPAAMELATLPDGETGIRLVVDVANADYPVVIDPIIGGGIIWESWIDQDANYGFSVSTAGDVNGDGFDDVLVGAPWFDGGEPKEGAVFAYYGGPLGLLPIYQWMVEGNEPSLELGYAVNPAGDINNDTFADIIVGTNSSPIGKALVFAGTPGGLNPVPVWIGLGEQAGDGFGTAVNTAGDVNNDNFDDIIVGAPYYDGSMGADSGRAYVFHGPVSTTVQAPDWIGEGGVIETFPGGLFGFSVSTAGDVNQDEFDDVIIGEPLGEDDGNVGLAVIFGGSPSGLVMPGGGEPAGRYDANWVSQGGSPTGSQYGAAVSFAGDVNGDGFDDVVVGAPQYSGVITSGGAIFVYTGTNPINNMNAGADPYSIWSFTSSVENALLGHSVGAAGDIDQDGHDDVIAGAPQFDNGLPQMQQAQAVNGGGAFIIHGTPPGLGMVWEISSKYR